MSNTVLVGLQWGDEGKGKIIDYLTEQSDIVVRFQGGNNAGHTVEIGDEQFILHLIPSGILHGDTLNVIGNGLVLNPFALIEEIEGLQQRGVDIGSRLRLSTRCQLLFPYHCIMDGLQEGRLGDSKIGTTRRGIGPAYADKASRCGIRAFMLARPDKLEVLFRAQAERYNEIFREAGAEVLDIEGEWERLRQAAETLAPMLEDTTLLLNRASAEDKSILFEGAQGAWLDIDFGTYPFVTSSNTTSGAACTGTGVAPSRINDVLGVVKAYCTRVGEGPFPTELEDETGEHMRDQGGEYGATTGRPRRCGWFDAVATRYSVMLNGAGRIALTKLDVLDDFETIRICTGYELDGEVITDMPTDNLDLERVRPVYEEMPGWQTDTSSVRNYDDLPERTRAYIDRLVELIDTNLSLVSVGPGRTQTITLNESGAHG